MQELYRIDGSISKLNLDLSKMADRKSVKARRAGFRSVRDNLPSSFFELTPLRLFNRYHYAPATFEEGWRRADKLTDPAPKIMLLDCDKEDRHPIVEKKLRDAGLTFWKVPSASFVPGEVDWKFHFFVLAKRLSADPGVLRGQLFVFYKELGITRELVDAACMGDVARYFAPCGAAEVFGTEAWKRRCKLCDEYSLFVEGKPWKAPKASKVEPMHMYASKGGKERTERFENGTVEKDTPPVVVLDRDTGEVITVTKPVKPSKLPFAENIEGVRSIQLFDEHKLDMGGEWLTLREIAKQMEDGEKVSNLVCGCPVRNPKHCGGHGCEGMEGYCYLKRERNTLWVNCGGDACRGYAYFYRIEPEMEDPVDLSGSDEL